MTISISKYKKLLEHISGVKGHISNDKHSISIKELNVLEEVFQHSEVVIRVVHTNCFECADVRKNCTGEFLVSELLEKLV